MEIASGQKTTGASVRGLDLVGVAAAAAAPLVLYAVSAPRHVVLEDDGLFLMAALHLGVAHPPGYPVYTLISHLFTYLPVGGIAYAVHLSSAVLGALACAGVWICARLLGASTLPALMAAWLFGVSEHVWSQAIIAEVYTLNALLFFAVLALILRGCEQPGRSWPWFGAAAAYGLGMANHWPLMVLAAPGLLAAAWPAWRQLLPRVPLLIGTGLAAAALPYAWMTWRSLQAPLISFYGPIDSVWALWSYINRSGYAGVDVSESAGWLDRLAFVQWFANESLWQLTLPGAALALFGLFVLWQRNRLLASAGLLVYFGNSVALVLLLAADFDVIQVAVFRPYSLVCYGILALWLAIGAERLLEAAQDWLRLAARWLGAVKASACAVLGGGMVLYSTVASWPVNNRAEGKLVYTYAEALFDLLPEGAVLFVSADLEVAPLGHYHYVEGVRPDLTLLSTEGLVYRNRLFPPLAPRRQQLAAIQRFVDRTRRPVFFTSGENMPPPGHGTRRHGMVNELIRAAPGSTELELHPESARYFAYLMALRPQDRWERLLRNQQLFRYGEFLGYVVLADDPVALTSAQASLQLAPNSFFSLMGMAETVLAHGDARHLARVEAWLAEAQTRRHEVLTKEPLGRFLYLKGYCAHRLGRRDAAIALFRESRDAYPHPENAASEALRQLQG